MRESEVSIERLNGESEPPRRELDHNRFKWKRVRYAPHQGGRERARRLAQVTIGRLRGPVVSAEAHEAAARISAALHYRTVVMHALEAAGVYINAALNDNDADAIVRRDHLYVAVADLWAWVKAGCPIEDTTRISALSTNRDRLNNPTP